MTRAKLLLAFMCVGAAAACGGVFTAPLGPAFAPAPNHDGAVVYLYRPPHLTMAVRPIHVVIDGEERIVHIGGYAAMRVTPGPHTIIAYSTPSSQNFVTYGFGTTAWRGAASLDAAAGGESYVRLQTSIGDVAVEVVDAARGAEEIQSCHLTPGGALR